MSDCASKCYRKGIAIDLLAPHELEQFRGLT